MIGLVCFIVFSLIVIARAVLKKDNLLIILTYITIAPLIKFGNSSIDASYLVLIMLYFASMIKNKIYLTESKYFVLFAVLCLSVFLISTIYYTAINFLTFQQIFGLIKIPLIVFFLSNLYKNKSSKDIYVCINKYIYLILILNIIASFIQFFAKDKVLDFFRVLYSNGYDYYMNVSGKYCYARVFGLFKSSMALGIVCLFIFSFILINYIKEGKINIRQTTLCLILGVMSSSKTFILGVPISVVCTFFYKLKPKKNIVISRKIIQKILIIIMLLPIGIKVITIGIEYLSSNGMYVKYYLNYLTNPVSALKTRYDTSEDILLKDTYEVIGEHIFLGVGFNSIKGEFIGDSTYVWALHNGGLIGLSIVIIFYLREIMRNYNKTGILFLIVWILSGFAQPTAFSLSVIIPFIYFYYSSYEEEQNELSKGMDKKINSLERERKKNI